MRSGRIRYTLPLLACLAASPGASQPAVDFARDIQPIFRAYCYSCHSGDKPIGKIRLDSKLAGSTTGVLLGRLLATDKAVRMPLGGAPLAPEKIALIRAWIDRGAPWPDDLQSVKHWAYQKPVRPAIPKAPNQAWARNPIDAFVLARLEKEGLAPSPEASKETLIRRASLDLTGLPPRIAEIDEFLADTRADAYERLIDRLLASPHYGERWARPWLDLARYADTNGFEKDRSRAIWKYRDWVIDAFNRDMPFDRFTIEQIAGDMLPDATIAQQIATGFNRNTMFNEEGGVDPDEALWTELVDRVNTTATVWLASTVGCAQCHDHKFDPFTQKEYYQLLAFFNNSEKKIKVYGDTSRKWIEPQLDLPTPEQAARRDLIQREIDEITGRMKALTPELEREQAAWERAVVSSRREWTNLSPSRVTSGLGATIAAQPDGTLVVSGASGRGDEYVIEARTAVRGITALRLEALPHASLPRGGPGRDTYGNFVLTGVDLEASTPQGGFERIEFTEERADNGRVKDKNSGQLWIVDASREDERLPRQLVLTAERPFGAGDALLRIRLRQKSEFAAQVLGCFRISVTAAVNPEQIVRVSHRLRPVLERSARTEKERQDLAEYFLSVAESLEPARDRLKALRKELDDLGIATTLVLRERPVFDRPSAHIRVRGNFTDPAELVYSGVPAALHPLPPTEMPNRLGLARWLASKENPLTARVAVNRFWETIFGRGIVETAEDFGSQGERPTHPEMLDWLAVEFMERGWSMKAIHRLIVTSATYRQSSAITPSLQERDPYNRLLARGPRFRMEAEMVRDAALAASGLLSSKVGGPSVFPPQPDGIWDLPYNDEKWTESTGEDRRRRGLYTFTRRTAPYPAMLAFDATSREVCTVRRIRTNTPLQALTTLNDPAFFETAEALARRVLSEAGSTDRDRIALAYRLCVARKPREAEVGRTLEWFDRERKLRGGSDLAAWTLLANVLLNLDETLTKE